MHHVNLRLFWLLGLLLTLLLPVVAVGQEPVINDRFPISDGRSLSPPVVQPHIYECARAAWVYGFIPKALVQVYARNPATGVNELVGHDTPAFSYGKIMLKRPLVLNEAITATQTVSGIAGAPSQYPVLVEHSTALTRPVIDPELYECGRIVSVHNLTASTHVEVSDLDAVPSPPLLLGTDENTGDWDAVTTAALVKSHHIQAVQITCPDNPAHRVLSPQSASAVVEPEPSPMPPPKVDDPIHVNVANMHNLLIGALIEVRDKASGTLLGSGLATAGDNYLVVAQPNSGHVLVTQSLCTASPAVEVSVTNSLPALTMGVPICEDSHYVSVDNTEPTATIVIIRNGDWAHPIGCGSGWLGAGVTLHLHDKITAMQYIGSVISPVSNEVEVGCDGGANVVTQHSNNARTGAYLAETTLTPSLVKTRGMAVKFRVTLNDRLDAQPLYVRRVAFENGGANGLFVTNWADRVYGMDANTGTEKWHYDLTDNDTTRRPASREIASPPVIDAASQRLYVVFGTRSGEPFDPGKLPNDRAYWLATLDIRNGKELARTQIGASVFDADGNTVKFEARMQNQHAALLLDHGSVYIAFCSIAGLEGSTVFHGWVMRYRASDLAFQSAFCASKSNPINEGAGIWQGGGGLAADPDGNLYFLTGNGVADPAHEKYGDCFVKLVPSPGGLIPTTFVPDFAKEMDAKDVDFGAGGAMLIPGTDTVLGGGKPGYMALLNRSSMTPAQQEVTATTNLYHPKRRLGSWNLGPHLHGSPTFWRGADPVFGNLYVWGEKDILRLFRFNTVTGKMNMTNTQKGTVLALPDTMPGGMISVSANGNTAKTGIVWATLPASDDDMNNPSGRIYAYDAQTLQWLWDAGYERHGHWVPPTIADGTVYVVNDHELIAYTLGPEDGSQRSAGGPFHPKAVLHTMSMLKRFLGEGTLTTPQQIARSLTSPPAEWVSSSRMEGDGKRVYEARKDAEGHLVWALSGSTMSLREIDSSVAARPIQVRLSAENVWAASDGSGATSMIEKNTPAPEAADVEWLLYRITPGERPGVFRDAGYIQCLYTQGGLPPQSNPARASDKKEVPFHAQYIFFRRP